ncbi:hypothetical protein HA402_015616 [Bradysia odoriphaga]|nr:hypothetical protein HA402_015616 [Bradysia odoriphaga]
MGQEIIRTSAKSLAERAGAAQYAVHIEEELTSEEIGKKHNLSKRRTSAFDDTDYEVYQGVVFHICEAGKKISFLCPNGTIFQQTDLICDWWFKVNCAASPGHYAESSEVLSRAQKRPNRIPDLSSENLSESRESIEDNDRSGKDDTRRNQQKKLKSRNEETFDNLNISGENFDFEDISSDVRKSNSRSRQSSRNVNRISHRNAKELSEDFLESQEVAESASFVVDRQNNFNGYHYEPPKQSVDLKTQSLNLTKTETSQNPSAAPDTNTTFTGYIYNQPDRNSRRLETATVRQELMNSTSNTTKITISSATNSRRGSVSYQSQGVSSRQERKQNIHSSPTSNSLVPDDAKPTISSVIGRHPSTYTTARRLETSRTTPFYTPTVPSIPSLVYRAPTSQTSIDPQTTTASATTTSTPSVSEHAMEMIRTIHELHLDNPRPTIESDRPVLSARPGLIIPPSSGPDTLHSLALYFATAVDNLMTNPDNQTTTSVPLRGDFDNVDVQIGNVTKINSAHVSNETIERYEKLFGIENEELGPSHSELSSRMDSSDDTRFTSSDNDLETEFSNNPVLAAAGSPQIRELAKVFTHALSAYLHDPSTFRRVLSEIRPTEPPIAGNDILSNRIGRTEDFNKGTGPTYLPTVATTSATATTTFTSTTEDFEVLDFSDVTLSTAKKELNYPSTTPSTTNPTTTDFPSTTTTTVTETEESSTVLSNLIQESLNTADRVPASRFLTEQLVRSPESREPKRLEETQTTTDANNPFALEINGGLIMSTAFPYFQDDSRESSKQSVEESSYFPAKESLESRSLLKPYGHDVSHNSSLINDTYPTALSDTQAVPLKWGEEITEDYSTQTTTDYPASLSFELLPPSAVKKGFSLPAKETLHPTIDENDLQRAQSQSLVASGNELLNEQKGRSFTATASPRFGDRTRTTTTEYPTTTTTLSGHFITHDYRTSTESQQSKTTIPDTGKFSPNPWSTLAYTVFLDPLTINDGLMDSKLKDITPSANTYLPRSTQTTPYAPTTTTSLPPVTATNPPDTQALFNRNSDVREGKFLSSSPFPTTVREPAEYMEVMQKKANEMFGNLNDTSATHLLNVMKKANKNKTVRKLILLLIQTCDDDYNTTVEESRTALLNALIGMDGKIDDDSDIQVINARPNRRGKSIARFEGNSVTESTSTETPITTFRRPLFQSFSTTTEPQYLFESTTNGESSRTTSNPIFDDISTTSANRANEGYGIYFRTDDGYTTTTSDGLNSHDPTDQTTYTAVEETTTLTPSTTTTTTTTIRPSTTNKPTVNRSRSSQSRRIAKDLDDLLGQSSQTIDPNASRTHKHSDTRALDLLRSLYSLAGRFGR